MIDKTPYEINKEKEKNKLVRNEFLYHNQSNGKYDVPIIKKQDIDIEKISFLSYVDAKKDDVENKDKTIHFFTYDWKFEKVYDNADEELEKLKQYYCLLSPDFSVFTNMPLALQINNIFKNRWCGAYWQSKGLKVIPTISWGDENTFDFCFDGVEEGAVVAVCTYFRENCEKEFMLGYNEMLKRIKPSAILCYDEPFDSMQGNVKSFLPTTYEWTKNLNWKYKMQFYFEKHNRNVSGLKKGDFKFFNYDDPYERKYIEKCPVCGKSCFIDQYGNGECDNCSWNLDTCSLELPDKVQYPNLVSLNKARKLYLEHQKFKPTFEEFIDALNNYSEMTFEYKNVVYVIYIDHNNRVHLYCDEKDVIFDDMIDFINNGNINGTSLKNIWADISNIDYLQG